MIQPETFESLRPRLFGIAYRMLGSAMEAEDIVQEAYVRARDVSDMQSARAYLTRVVTNLCLDQLKSARAQREVYVGEWLPEPIFTPIGDSAGAHTPDEAVEDRETLSMAFLLLLDHLSPPERAVFVLHEVFDYGYGEIAETMDKTPAACRQLLRRAKQHLGDPHLPSADPNGRALLEQFISALTAGDVPQIMALLAEDVVMIADGGGKVAAATRPIYGTTHVARFLHGLKRGIKPSIRVTTARVNGQESLIVWDGDRVEFVSIPEWRDGKLYRLYQVRNPDKLHLRVLAT